MAITLNIIFGFIRGPNLPAEVLVIWFDLADVGPGARRVFGARDGGKLDFVQVLVPVRSHVPGGPEEPEETETTAMALVLQEAPTSEPVTREEARPGRPGSPPRAPVAPTCLPQPALWAPVCPPQNAPLLQLARYTGRGRSRHACHLTSATSPGTLLSNSVFRSQ